MANEVGGSPGDTSDTTSPFDVAPEAAQATPGTYLIGVEEIEHEELPDAEDVPLATEAAVKEATVGIGARANARQIYFDLPPVGPVRQVPDFFPPAMIPKGIKFPQGIEAMFIKIPADFTCARHKGDRFLIIWGTSEADEALVLGRSMSDPNRATGQLAKQVVRAIDGHVADWSGLPTPGSVDQLWREIGPKGRNLLIRMMAKVNTLEQEELGLPAWITSHGPSAADKRLTAHWEP